MIVHARFQIDHARDGRLGDHHVVEGFVGRDDGAFSNHLAGQHAAGGDPLFAAQGTLEFGVDFIDGECGEKTQAAQIHREDGNIAATDGARGREQRAVAAQHDDELGSIGNPLTRKAIAAAQVEGRLVVVARAHPMPR